MRFSSNSHCSRSLSLSLSPSLSLPPPHRAARVIENVNVIIATYSDEKDKIFGDVQVYPYAGTVSFGSGLHQWGFTLPHFARMYAKKFGIDIKIMMEKLWGNNFYNRATNKWTRKNKKGDLERGFVQFILKPIANLFDSIMNKRTNKKGRPTYHKMLKTIGVTLKGDEKDLMDKPL